MRSVDETWVDARIFCSLSLWLMYANYMRTELHVPITFVIVVGFHRYCMGVSSHVLLVLVGLISMRLVSVNYINNISKQCLR